MKICETCKGTGTKEYQIIEREPYQYTEDGEIIYGGEIIEMMMPGPCDSCLGIGIQVENEDEYNSIDNTIKQNIQSVSYWQRRYKLNYFNASKIVETLKSNGAFKQ